MESNKSALDIIITHYNEPWEVGKPFFDMYENQRLLDNKTANITLVQDGKENNLPWDDIFSMYSFPVNVITIDHSGPAAARNAGIKNTSADWIMFCDFDDLFMNVLSLKMILDLFPVTDYDLLWGKTIYEQKWNARGTFPNRIDFADLSNTTCKFFRRSVLEDNHIMFNTSVPYHYEYMFNSLVISVVPPFRIAKITAEPYLYVKTFRPDSMRNTLDGGMAMMHTIANRNIALAETYKRRGDDYLYREAIASVIFAEYYRLYNADEEPNPAPESDEFIEFYKKYKDVLHSLSEAELETIKDKVETEIMSMIQNFFNIHKIEFYFVNDEISFNEWEEKIMHRIETGKIETVRIITNDQDNNEVVLEPVIIPTGPYVYRGEQYQTLDEYSSEQNQTDDYEPRVAVYCGTYNTYMSMVTSAKSLLYHTRMDKIYFLIEDDEFPYELPSNGIIECINVKDQQWFPETGPNYNNDWSYMCMMRGAFAKIFPQYKKIMSFDIDVVIQEDIGCLWDDYDVTDYYLAGVIEPCRQQSTNDPPYVNFGVVMMNLDKIRRDGIDDLVINELNTQKLGCPEQDAFNKHCAWHILQLPNDYNATVNSHITGEAQKERIIHYAGIRYWRHFGSVKEYGLKEWDFIMERQAKLHE